MNMSASSKPRIVIFPFMSKGHMIPLLSLAKLLLQRNFHTTIFTTPSNHSFVSEFLPTSDGLTVVDLPFPYETPEIPRGVESTDKLPSMSLFVPFVNAWTLGSASKFGIPRLSFYGLSYYATVIFQEAMRNGLLFSHESPDEPFALPCFPHIELTRNHFDSPLDKKDPRGPHFDMMVECITATSNSYGLLMNSFYELEKTYVDYYNLELGPKAWSIGPLCLAQSPDSPHALSDKTLPNWITRWLDEKFSEKKPVLYVAFGSQAEVSPEQMKEIASGLEDSNSSFLWVVKKTEAYLNDNFEERVKNRGIVVKEWVDQHKILEHEAVQGFLSHCGWNSVLEGLCAEVPILALPMMADQFINAKMVEEDIKIGLRMDTIDRSPKGLVTKESLKSSIVELMESDKGKVLKHNVKFLAEKAKTAIKEGGSSWINLNQLICEIQKQREINLS